MTKQEMLERVDEQIGNVNLKLEQLSIQLERMQKEANLTIKQLEFYKRVRQAIERLTD